MAVLLTDSPTDIKLIIILIYSVGDMLKFRRQYYAVRGAFNAQPFEIRAVRR